MTNAGLKKDLLLHLPQFEEKCLGLEVLGGQVQAIFKCLLFKKNITVYMEIYNVAVLFS